MIAGSGESRRRPAPYLATSRRKEVRRSAVSGSPNYRHQRYGAQVVTAERHLYGDRDPVRETSKLPNSAGDRWFESISLQPLSQANLRPHDARPPRGAAA